MLHLEFLRSPYAHARITSIDTSAASAVEGVVAVVTGELLAQHNLAWMPTLSGDTQAVLATDKVRFQGQEVAAVIAESPYIAKDACELIEVDYEPLEAITTPQRALEADAPVIRDEKEGQTDNHIYDWEAGDKEATDKAFADADKVVELDTFYPRCHPGAARVLRLRRRRQPGDGQGDDLHDLAGPARPPHALRDRGRPARAQDPDRLARPGRRLRQQGADLPRLRLRHGGLAPDRPPREVGRGPHREPHLHRLRPRLPHARRAGAEGRQDHRPAREDALRQRGVLRRRAADQVQGRALPHRHRLLRHPGGAHRRDEGAYTNKAPGGVAYRCSFRVTEASYLIERLVQTAAYETGVDPVDFRKQNFIKPEQFPYKSATGFEYDSGDYGAAMDLALEKLGYADLRREQEEARAEGRLIGIGVASFTEVVGAGHGADYDIAGLRMNDGAELRIHPTGKAVLKLSVKSQGQGHETTFAQIVAEELGLQPEDVEVQEGDTDHTPYGLGTYASRSTPVSGAATSMVSRRIRAKAQKIAAHLLEASEDDLEWEKGRFVVKGAPEKSKTIQDVAFAAYTNIPEGMEGGLEGVYYYDPPNMTYPFGTYAVVVEIDRGTGAWKVLRCVAVDDCGVRINPMIVAGQITGGLTEGFAIAAMQLIDFDEDGNCIGSNFMDYLIPTAWETPKFELGETVTPSPHHPLGAKGVGESATVGAPAAFVNAVVDALAHAGVRNLEMPVTSDKVWAALQEANLGE